MSLSTIAVGVDRSSTATQALGWAAGLAAESGSRIAAIGTWQMPLITSVQGALQMLPTRELVAQQCAAAVDAASAEIDEAVPLEVFIIESKPGPGLVKASANTDLLVVGRTGYGKRRGISRLAEIVLGSAARHCLHHAQIPVATVPEESQWKTGSKVIVGLDGSENSFGALRWADENLPDSSQITVVRAVIPWVGDGLFPNEVTLDNEAMEALRVETQQWVNNTLGDEHGVAVELVIGTAVDALTSQPHTDLVVVGARGHTGVAGNFLGSVADHLVRYAVCPVITVPA